MKPTMFTTESMGKALPVTAVVGAETNRCRQWRRQTGRKYTDIPGQRLVQMPVNRSPWKRGTVMDAQGCVMIAPSVLGAA